MTTNKQLSFPILPSFSYRPEHFVVHKGVASLIEEIKAIATKPGFAACYVEGQARFGKTHLVVYLASIFSSLGLFPRVVLGQNLSEIFLTPAKSDEIILVDDADFFLGKLKPGDSGPFVSFMENLRAVDSKIIFFGAQSINSFEFDGHICSRLKAGSGLQIQVPDEASQSQLIDIMAKQRGIKLSEKKQEFLERRLGRGITAIEEYLERLVHLSSVLGQKVGFSLLGDAL